MATVVTTSLLGPLRLPFLLLTPVCILLGLAVASVTVATINLPHLLLIVVGALSAHISVNTFNEYFDYQSGLDLQTRRTPFSGGSGTLPNKPELAPAVLNIALISFAITSIIGLYLLSVSGWGLLPVGLMGLALVLCYTTYLTRSPILCLLAPGIGFGPLMVMGTLYVLTGEYSWMAFAASLVPFFLISNLLLLNQFPDVEADRLVGRKHFPIVIGKRNSGLIFGLFLALAYLVLIFAVAVGVLPIGSLLGMATLVIAIPIALGVWRNAENPGKLLLTMRLNVMLSLVTPALIAIGIFIG